MLSLSLHLHVKLCLLSQTTFVKSSSFVCLLSLCVTWDDCKRFVLFYIDICWALKYTFDSSYAANQLSCLRSLSCHSFSSFFLLCLTSPFALTPVKLTYPLCTLIVLTQMWHHASCILKKTKQIKSYVKPMLLCWDITTVQLSTLFFFYLLVLLELMMLKA